MALDQAPTQAPEIDYQQLGREVFIQSQREVAARNGKINDVSSEITQRVNALDQGNDSLNVGDAVTDDPIFQQEPIDRKQIMDQACRLLDEDRKKVHGDVNVVLFGGDSSLRGFYNGDSNVHMNIEGGLDESTWVHEADHRKNGFIAGVGLDEELAGDVEEDLSQNAIENTDTSDTLLTYTQRMGSEESATDAAGESTAAYNDAYVEPTDEVIHRMDEAQLSGRQVVNRLIEGHDVNQFREAVRHTLEYEAAQNPSLN